MNSPYPLHTEKRECQDCYKCVRHCPVKAISVKDGSALVTHELCIYCGRCYEICPVGAKKVPSEVHRAEALLSRAEAVYVSLSPSFFSEFAGREDSVLTFLYGKGAAGVSETAIGAEFVSRAIGSCWDDSGRDKLISTACPAIVTLINLYFPDLKENMTPIASPMIVHGRYLKEKHGPETRVLFIGPCIAKKGEALDEGEAVDVALSFEELAEWMECERLYDNPSASSLPEDFLELRAGKASLYPMDGGMIQSLEDRTDRGRYYSISGIDRVRETLEEVRKRRDDGERAFFELLSCAGGCINGPARTGELSYYKKTSLLYDGLEKRRPFTGEEGPPVHHDYRRGTPLTQPVFSEGEIEAVLIGLDKTKKEDRLNCGGCGYNSCRDFAVAKLQGKAEKEMCAGNMRKQAQKKVNALIKTIPAGVVIVDQDKKIVECNSRFLDFFSEADMSDYQDMTERLKGLDVANFGPFEGYYNDVLARKREKHERLCWGDAVFKATFFTIEQNRLAGAIFEDVTQPSIRRGTIITKAEEVIRKNLESVQQIASLLGENAAETEIILNSVIEELKPPAKKESP
ncbi:MAG: [Fe-Fe] hydrogenase large subunit C-terminal domain-containing protein [Spirochaetales bacterium]|nr:[Fe-Fe] hydrogenase large subunit C-terminal domain-containing protein [Spirochaetales bacterium]